MLQELKEKIYKKLDDLKNEEILLRCNRAWEAWNFGTMSEEDFEEVENEITLADILRYLRCILKDFEQVSIYLSGDKDYIVIQLHDCTNIYWNLKENLDNQSKQTIEFLNKLI